MFFSPELSFNEEVGFDSCVPAAKRASSRPGLSPCANVYVHVWYGRCWPQLFVS